MQDRPLIGARILVAEDNALQAFDLMTLLKDAGAEIVGPAKTVADVLALAGTEALCCALLDVYLRREPVFPAAKALRERGVRLVFYTGGADLDSLRREWPDARIISKPASPDLLLNTIAAGCHALGTEN